jgi:hypothetical protein
MKHCGKQLSKLQIKTVAGHRNPLDGSSQLPPGTFLNKSSLGFEPTLVPAISLMVASLSREQLPCFGVGEFDS